METTRLDLTPVERAALMALVGLAVTVMQNDRENGQQFIELLSAKEMEGVCMGLVHRLNGTPGGDHAARH